MGRLSELLNADITNWKPEEGDIVEGTVVAVSDREGYEGVHYNVYALQDEDGALVAVHAFHSVLRNELSSVQPGDTVAIKYLGKVKKYQGYRVVVDRGARSEPIVNNHITIEAPDGDPFAFSEELPKLGSEKPF